MVTCASLTRGIQPWLLSRIEIRGNHGPKSDFADSPPAPVPRAGPAAEQAPVVRAGAAQADFV
jgi:hypothetical protein